MTFHFFFFYKTFNQIIIESLRRKINQIYTEYTAKISYHTISMRNMRAVNNTQETQKFQN